MLHDDSDKARQLCRQLKPLIGDQADRLWMGYLAENEAGREQILDYLELLAAQQFHGSLNSDGPGLVPPEAREAAGEYVLGDVAYNGKPIFPFGLRENEWTQHVGVFGRSGAGKTNLGFIIVKELLAKGKPVLVFDWKRNYRDLVTLPGFEKVAVYTVGRPVSPFSFNPLIPPRGTNPQTWLKKLIQVIAHAYLLGDGVMYLLQEAIDQVYRDAGVYDGSVARWPTFRDVSQTLRDRKTSGREAGWLSSAMRAVSSLCFGDMDQLLNEGNDDLEELLTRPVILELDGLTQSDKVMVAEAMLLWIHHFRMAGPVREVFCHSIVIEEAHHLLADERKALSGGQSVMEITFREIREFGEAMVILDQHPSQISMSALGNSYCTFCFNLKHRTDVNAISQAMLLQEEARDIPGNLQIGEAIVRLQGRSVKPFVIHVPEFVLTKGSFTDAMVSRHMIDLGLLSSRKQAAEASCGLQAEVADPLDMEQAFLSDVERFPNSGIAERYRRLGLTVRLGQKLKAHYIEKGLLQEYIQTTHQGRLRVIRLTEEGRLSLPEAHKQPQ